MSARHAPGSACMRVRAARWSFEGPPSVRYAASVNGAPAKPMSGVAHRSPTRPSARSREFGDRALHGLGDRGGCLVEVCRVDRGQFGDGSGIGICLREDGPATRLDLDVDADELQRHDDVAEEDARVDPVPTHRLQRDLARHRRVETRVEHARADPQLAVLGQRPARLPHEPHRRRVGALTAVGADETGVGSEAGRERMLRGEDHG